MRVPEGYTEDAVIKIIYNVANRLAHKYRFGYLGVEDIKQEVAVIAIQGLEKYNGKHPLENFLYIHSRNRLYNLKRKEYMRPNATDLYNIAKRNIMCPIDIDNVCDESEDNMKYFNDVLDVIADKEIMETIDTHLPVKYRADYSKMRYGIKIPKAKQDEIQSVIAEILGKNDAS